MKQANGGDKRHLAQAHDEHAQQSPFRHDKAEDEIPHMGGAEKNDRNRNDPTDKKRPCRLGEVAHFE